MRAGTSREVVPPGVGIPIGRREGPTPRPGRRRNGRAQRPGESPKGEHVLPLGESPRTPARGPSSSNRPARAPSGRRRVVGPSGPPSSRPRPRPPRRACRESQRLRSRELAGGDRGLPSTSFLAYVPGEPNIVNRTAGAATGQGDPVKAVLSRETHPSTCSAAWRFAQTDRPAVVTGLLAGESAKTDLSNVRLSHSGSSSKSRRRLDTPAPVEPERGER
jgi:hypothetical protein